jgi:hypothetical protein
MAPDQFIHAALTLRAEGLVQDALASWRQHRKIEPYAITWPSEDIKDDNDNTVSHVVFCALPAGLDAAQRMLVLQQFIERTKAYGLAVVEQKDDHILVLFETQQGARSWRIPLAWHGDIQVPGQAEERINEDCVGLLWRQGSRH